MAIARLCLSLQLRWRPEKHCPDWSDYGRAMGTYWLVQTYTATNKSSAMSYRASKFLVAESISKETPHIFVPKRWNRFFAIYVVRLVLLRVSKNICDGVGCQNGSNGTPLDPPLFWLDNIFKLYVYGSCLFDRYLKLTL